MNATLFLRVIALVLFVIAVIVAVGDVQNAHSAVWVPAGLAAWVTSELAEARP